MLHICMHASARREHLIWFATFLQVLFAQPMGQFLTKYIRGERKHHFADSLKGFKYQFNADGQLRHTETGDQFEFMIKDNDHQYNQRRYEALGKIIDKYIYLQLEEETHLKRIKIPVDAEQDEPVGFFFASDDAETNTDRLMVIIHGSGVVRAGQWSRRLIINDRLETGSQLPYIKKAIEKGYSVIVTNTNLNYQEDDSTKRLIRGSESPEEHMLYVWRNFVKKCPARHVDVLAHSYGGIVTVHWLNMEKDARDRVCKVAFTDSVHGMYKQGVTQETADWFIKNSINWVSTFAPLNTYQGQLKNDVHKLSAGTDVHELTSHSCFDTIFKYFSADDTTFDFLNREAIELEMEITFSNSKAIYREGVDEIDELMNEQEVKGKPQEQRLEADNGGSSMQEHKDTNQVGLEEQEDEAARTIENQQENGQCPHTDDVSSFSFTSSNGDRRKLRRTEAEARGNQPKQRQGINSSKSTRSVSGGQRRRACRKTSKYGK
ncbi:cotranscriptional regulator FAM172A homolog isoform X2 [Corticium candelabrum]|uniref:cotranscriptional regulator FAM172A homolog isoform X2 n=1 Tax=Corticium candelabrum TaxID=121492 RepID=UPI002E2616DB|nr:cotranscriptional regulator FAM172A homolog isoform X2 [Corticium candelabrum]